VRSREPSLLSSAPPGGLDPFVASAAQLADSALTIHDALPAMQIFASRVTNGSRLIRAAGSKLDRHQALSGAEHD
jgi:hypothetical protein